jgi:hypothetical protein
MFNHCPHKTIAQKVKFAKSGRPVEESRKLKISKVDKQLKKAKTSKSNIFATISFLQDENTTFLAAEPKKNFEILFSASGQGDQTSL